MPPTKAGIAGVTEERLRLSRAPAAELAAAALEAQAQAGLATADILVIAVEPGAGDVAALERARAAVLAE